MQLLNLQDIYGYVENNIGVFHNKRLKSLEKLRLDKILKRKNPYLFKAKNILTAQDVVRVILDAYLSSQEETIFGEFLEGLAIFINEKVYGGRKSAAEGIDLEFEKEDIKYIVSIKSGPNWGNSSQIKKMKDNFRKAKRILGTNTSKMNIVAVNGCCYGRDNKPEKDEYLKLCGERFWCFISGNRQLYTDIVEPLGHQAKQKNDEFTFAYSNLINKFTIEFGKDFCDKNGAIDWEKIVIFNSSEITSIKRKK
ncbi:MAG: PmeII family type II restriction endonuclease [Bacteroidota bacterium]|nr:PmeII family type II restriction endonuclease [Bacteroidota bacterium]